MALQSPETQRTIGQLVVDATRDVEGLVRSEIALAKAEVQQGVAIMGKGAGLLAAAGVVALFAVGFVLTTLAYVIAIWLPVWAGFLIVGVVLLIVTGILAAIGVKALKSARPAPERAIAEAKQTIALLRP
ncbi:MAG: phage holin family protein [Phycicoccus sp.]|nr:phage holin family protein [Phycicoccus sp.]